MKKLIAVSMLFTISLVGCGKDNDAKGGGQPSQSAALTNPYWDEFVAAYALPANKLPPVENRELEVGGYAIRSNDQVVRVGTLYADGRASVADISGPGYYFTANDLVPRSSGALGLFEGFFAITTSDSIVALQRVFKDGRAEVIGDGINYVFVAKGLVAQKLGYYEGRFAITSGNQVVEVSKVFGDGRAQVYLQGTNTKSVERNLVPEKNGAAGLFEGTWALTKSGTRVYILRVFADGRAQVEPDGMKYKTIERELTPSAR